MLPQFSSSSALGYKMMISCCNQTFFNQQSYKFHIRQYHQSKICIKFNGDSSKYIYFLSLLMNIIEVFHRQNDVFTCVCGSYSNKCPTNFRRHAVSCLNKSENDQELIEENESDFNQISYLADNSLLENDFLNRYNVAINIKHHLLVCRTCKYVIEEESLLKHVSSNHRKIVETKYLTKQSVESFVEEINFMDPFINSNFQIQSEDIIQGLKLYDGYSCNKCGYLCCHKATIRNHLKLAHNNEPDTNSNNQNQITNYYEECNIQTLFLKPEKRRYFRVKKISMLPNQVETIDRECIERIFARTNSNNRGDQLRTGHQFVSSFHTEANWNYVFDKFNNEEIENIVGIQVDKKLEESMGKIFDQGEKFSKVVNHHFNQLIDNPLSK